MKVLPALRIIPLLNRTFGPAVPTGRYALVINWDPKDPSFNLKDKSIKEGEFGKFLDSWTQAYATAMAVIQKIDQLYHKRALIRGLTPIPLQLLNVSVQEWETECNGTAIAAAYSWEFLGNTSGKFNVVVDEQLNLFEGIHDSRPLSR